MMGHTHALIGFTAGALWSHATGAPVETIIVSGAAAAVAALLPDIDHPSGAIRQRMGAASGLFFWLKHRGITHTLAALLIVSMVAFVVAPARLVIPIALGYGSHLIADGITKSGIPLFLPLSEDDFHLLPRRLRITTGGPIEQVIAMGTATIILMLGNEFYPVFEWMARPLI